MYTIGAKSTYHWLLRYLLRKIHATHRAAEWSDLFERVLEKCAVLCGVGASRINRGWHGRFSNTVKGSDTRLRRKARKREPRGLMDHVLNRLNTNEPR